MNEDLGGCIIFVLCVTLLAGLLWLLRDHNESYKEGYVQALVDSERKRPLRYKRVEQGNGETIWIKNEDKGK